MNSIAWPALLQDVAAACGTSTDGTSAFWVAMPGTPVINVEPLPQGGVLLHATLGEPPRDGDGLSTYRLLCANRPGAQDRGAFAIDPVEDRLTLFQRVDGGVAGVDAVLAIIGDFAQQATGAWDRLFVDEEQAPGAWDADGDAQTAPEQEQIFQNLRSELVFARGLATDGGTGAGHATAGDPPFVLETDDGLLLTVALACESASLIATCTLCYLPLDDADDDPLDDHGSLRPLLQAHLGGQETSGAVFSISEDDELQASVRLPLDGLDALALGRRLEELAQTSKRYAAMLNLTLATA